MIKEMVIRIIVGGPPNSGKSVFSERLVRALQDGEVDAETQELDLWAGTVDYLRGNILKDERARLKRNDVTEKDMKNLAKEFVELSKKHDVVIGDAPGGISDLSEIAVREGTHGIIVCREDRPEDIERWQKFFRENNVELIAVIHTSMNGDESILNNNPVEARLVNLDRCLPVTVTSTTASLANMLRIKLGI